MSDARAPHEELLLRFSSEVMLVVDPATLGIVAASHACARRLGYADGAPVGMRITDVDVSMQSAIYWAAVGQAAGEALDRVHTQYRRADGTILDAVQSIFTAGEDGGALLVVRCDELADRKSEFADDGGYAAHLGRILESAAEGIMVLDSARRIITVNRRLLSLWGVPRTISARADSAEMLRFMSAQVAHAGTALDAMPMIVAPGDEGGAETLPLNTGRTLTRRHQKHATPGDPRGAIVTFIDVSASARTEKTLKADREFLADLVAGKIAELRDARDEAEAASRAKSDFLAKMSHELRTPLHAILSYASFGEDRGAVTPMNSLLAYFRRIRNSGERLLLLVNDLLDLSKTQSGEAVLNPVPQDVGPILEDALLELEVLAQSKWIDLRSEFADGAAVAAIDGLRLGQVVRNLLGNAIKFTPPGGRIVLRLRRQARRDDADTLVIEVEDNGIGIPEDQLEDIFREFVQSRHHDQGAGGTGLGLAICREIMLAHGGSIHAANNPAGGATITATLPACSSMRTASAAALLVPVSICDD